MTYLILKLTNFEHDSETFLHAVQPRSINPFGLRQPVGSLQQVDKQFLVSLRIIIGWGSLVRNLSVIDCIYMTVLTMTQPGA